MKKKLRKIADTLEQLGFFKEAVKIDKIAEMLPEIGGDINKAYSLFGLSSGSRGTMTPEEFKKLSRGKIAEAYPRMMPTEYAPGEYEERNNNTRILIDAAKLIEADLAKFKETGKGLGEEGESVQSDFYKWQQGFADDDLKIMAQKLADDLKKTRTMYMHVKRKGEEFGEDDEKVQELRSKIADFNKRVAEKGIVWVEIKVPDTRSWRGRDLVLGAKIDLSTGIVLELHGVAWRNSAKGRQLLELQDRFVGKPLDRSAIRQAIEDNIKEKEYYIMRRKQQLLTGERVGEMEEKAVVMGDVGFYKEFLTSTPSMAKIENLVGIGIQSGAIRKLEKGPHKGLLTVEEGGLDKLLASPNMMFQFSGLVFNYIKTMVKQSYGGIGYYPDRMAESMIYGQLGVSKEARDKDAEFVKMYYGEDLGFGTYKIHEQPEKYKVAIELNEKVDKLGNLINLRAKEYAHAIAQIYKMGGVAQYYDPDTYAKARPGTFINDFYNSLSEHLRSEYEKKRREAEEFLSQGESAIDVSQYAEELEKRKPEMESKLKEYQEQKAREEEDAIKAQQEDKVKKIEEKKELYRQTRERLKDARFTDDVITEYNVDNYNKMMKFYVDIISSLPELGENFYPMVAKAQSLAQPQEEIPHFYSDDNPLKKWWKAIKDRMELYERHPESEDAQKSLLVYKKVWPMVDTWKRSLDKFMKGQYGEMKTIYLSVPEDLKKPEVKPQVTEEPLAEAGAGGGKGTIYLNIDKIKGRYGEFNVLKVSGDTKPAKDTMYKYKGRWFGQGEGGYWSFKPEVRSALTKDLEAAGFKVIFR